MFLLLAFFPILTQSTWAVTLHLAQFRVDTEEDLPEKELKDLVKALRSPWAKKSHLCFSSYYTIELVSE